MLSSTVPVVLLATSGLFQPTLAAWDPTRPAVFDSSYESRQEADLLNELASHTLRSEAWAAGWIPKYCYNEAKTKGLNLSDFEVRNVFYTDCDAAWAICRHKSTTRDWDYIIDVSTA